MSQDNASFTFLHRIEEVELNIEDGRWQSALALALTLPDICGGIAFPEIVKRYRDGRAAPISAGISRIQVVPRMILSALSQKAQGVF